jgi:anthranilate synthase component 1
MAELTIVPSRERFAELAKLGNVVPVFVDFVADGETPASAYQKLDDGDYSFLFESAEQTEQSGRYSFLGFSPQLIVRGENGEDPLAALEKVMARFRVVAQPDLPRFAGDAVEMIVL